MREMKDSNIPWIKTIPLNWKVMRVQDGFEQKKSKAHQDDPVVLSLARSGVKVRDMSNAEGQFASSYYDYNPVTVDDLLLNPMDLISGDNCSISTVDGVISPAYVNLRYRKGFNPKYYHYYFKYQYWSKAFFSYGKGVSFDNRWTLNNETLMRFPLVVPYLEEQTSIADFLDIKCSEIDALTEDIRSEIEILEAYKKSKVFDVIGHGIDNSLFKQTESDVWKNIPEEWKLVDIKYVFEIVKRIAGKEGYNIIAITQQGLKYKDITTNEGQIASDYSGYQFVYPGDYAMNHMDLLTGWVDLSDKFGVTSPDYRVFRLRYPAKYDKKFYKYVMQCCYMCKIFYSLGQGVSNLGRWRLQTSAFNDFKVPVPPYEEQVEIGNYLESEISQINGIISEKQKQLEFLADYKKSVIYEYVTGKKEVI